MPAPVRFNRQVSHALAHLYDPDSLRGHPLIPALGLSDSANAQEALREALIAAIEALRPLPSAPSTSRTWRVYNLLQCRYVQQLDQEQTADQLGVGPRHVRREQQVAVRALADALYSRQSVQEGARGLGGTEADARLEDELSWLKAAAPDRLAVLADTLQGALQLVAPLAAARHRSLRLEPLPELPSVAIHPAGLRQAIVSTSTWAIRRASGGEVRFSAHQERGAVLLTLDAKAHRQALAPQEEDESLGVARSILAEFGGRMEVEESATSLSATLTLPTADVVDVLLIDDNGDAHQLCERCVAGTRYKIYGIRTTEHLFEVVGGKAPTIILLDVMMPGVDGWEVLGRLRQHPLTAALPVVVCTILPEKDLALALGATGFLRKPITRQALLAALADAEAERGPH